MEYDVNIVTIHRAENFGCSITGICIEAFFGKSGL